MKLIVFLVFVGSVFAQTKPEPTVQHATTAEQCRADQRLWDADKCTPEIYQQLKAKDNAPLDSTAAAALKAVKEYQTRLKNPDSIQVRTAYVTDEGAICLEIAAQIGADGMGVSRVVYFTPDWKGAKRLREHWLDESGVGGSASADVERMRGSGYEVDRWDRIIIKSRTLLPGTDVTEKVKEALKHSQ